MQDEDDIISDVIHRKTAFMEDRKRSLGPEYYSNKPFWDRMWEQEWEQFELHSNAEPQVIDGFSSNRIQRFIVKSLFLFRFHYATQSRYFPFRIILY